MTISYMISRYILATYWKMWEIMMLLVSIPALEIWQCLFKYVELIYFLIKGETPTKEIYSKHVTWRIYKGIFPRNVLFRHLFLERIVANKRWIWVNWRRFLFLRYQRTKTYLTLYKSVKDWKIHSRHFSLFVQNPV